MAPALVVFRREQAHGQMLFLGNRPHDVAYRLDHRRHRKDGWLLLDELITALREFDDVARHRRESQRRGVDETELAALHVVHGTTLAALQRLGEDEDRRQRRAQVVRDIHEQREPVRTREMLRERLRPTRFDRDAQALH